MSMTFFSKREADANVENAGKAPALKVDEVKAPAEPSSEKEAPVKKTDAEKLKGNKE